MVCTSQGAPRPEFQRMIDAATTKPPAFDVILVHSFSRFFRDQFQLEFYVRRLAKNGVQLVSITQERICPLNLSSAFGAMRRSLPSFEMLNPRNLRSSGRATALFASLILSRSLLVKNRLTEAMTRSPARRPRT